MAEDELISTLPPLLATLCLNEYNLVTFGISLRTQWRDVLGLGGMYWYHLVPQVAPARRWLRHDICR